VFQDQTARIAQKYHTTETDMTLHSKDRHHNLTFFVPPMPVEQIALQHYLDQFNITRGPGPRRGQNHPELIITSVTSVGLAALAAAQRDPHLMQLARRKYSTALRLLTHAIQDPEHSPAAHTATSSFNLSVFEV
jgi:hypothetical protein